MANVEVYLLNDERAASRTIGYLGHALFRDYREACGSAGFAYDREAEVQCGPLALAPAVIESLKQLGFVVRTTGLLWQRLAALVDDAPSKSSIAVDEHLAVVEADLGTRGLELYPFQRDGVRWLCGRSRALLGDHMGLGKTITALVSIPYETTGVLVVCPAHLKGVWRDEAKKWRPDLSLEILSGRGSFRWPRRGEILICNYDILPGEIVKNRMVLPQELVPAPSCLVIVDEAHYCFPGDTTVLTDQGPFDIREIVEKRLPVSVASWNENSLSMEMKPIDDWLEFPVYDDLVTITHEYGTLTCTADHQIWTEEGWTTASALTGGARLRMVRQEVLDDQQGQQNDRKVLRSILCQPQDQLRSNDTRSHERRDQEAAHRKAMRPLRQDVLVSVGRKEAQQATILQPIMFGQVAHVASAIQENGSQERRDHGSLQHRIETSRRSQAHAGEQPDARSSSETQSGLGAQGSNLFVARRERATNKATTSAPRDSRAAHGARYQDPGGKESFPVSSHLLQSGSGPSGCQTRHRGRRAHTSNEEVEIPRQKENRDTQFSRVERIEILERGGSSRARVRGDADSRVYCLSVAGNHNFFANGVLVANCKGSKSQRSRKFRALSAAVLKGHGRVFALTGTPMIGRPAELWNVLRAARLELEAFDSWPRFVELFGGDKGRYGYEWADEPDPEVPDRLRRVMLRRLRREVLPDLPEKSYREILVEELDADTRNICDDTVRILAEAGVELTESTTEADLRNNPLAFGVISAARTALAAAKIPYLLSLVAQYEENEEPLVVFSDHRAPIDVLAKRPGWAAITGDVNDLEERADIAARFRDGIYKGIALTVGAGGTGLTLCGGVQQAAQLVFVSRPWDPSTSDQCEDRLVRIGQTRGVLVTDLVADHKLDRRLWEIVRGKRRLIEATLGERRG